MVVDRHRIFGDYLRKAREKRGVTLSALAKILGCSAPYLSDVETGRRNPLASKKLEQAAEYLGLQRDKLEAKAAISLGQFKLPAGTAKADKIAIRLSQVWAELDDSELQAIERIVERIS